MEKRFWICAYAERINDGVRGATPSEEKNEKMGVPEHTSLYFPISTNCAETKRSDDADYRRYSNNDDALHYAGLCNYPRQPQEEHHAPYIQETWYQDTLDPS